ncbi:MAG: hypothetical protein KDA77_02275 [Planctomycetaceae bacterium]|nr:hypothetical protein [Planctomycetaceae bacterium]
MFDYGVTGGVITVILGFALPYFIPPLADVLTHIFLFVGLNPRCGALECLTALLFTSFLIGYGIGAMIFFIKRNKSA